MGSAIPHALHFILQSIMMQSATSRACTISLMPDQCVITTVIITEVSAKLILGYAHQTRAMTPRWAVSRSVLACGILFADKAMQEIFGLLTPVSFKFHRRPDC
jgi:hypothetical protein